MRASTTCPVELTLQELKAQKYQAPIRRLVKRIGAWRLDDDAGYSDAIELLCDAETLLQQVLR